MTEIQKRAISGFFYILVMCLGTSYSELTFRLLFLILFLISLYEMNKLRKEKNKLISILFVIIPFTLIQIISENNNEIEWNRNIILFMFIITWTFDSFAYILGSKYGKHKIIPLISPKKSWEGFIGGFLASIIISLLIYKWFQFESLLNILILSTIIPFSATIGDFIESYYKREAKVKDSGKIMPGHGGILDRMDAFLVTIPVIYILTKIL